MAKEKRGFASMDPAKQRMIASKGGKASRRGKAKSRNDGSRGARESEGEGEKPREVHVGSRGSGEEEWE